MGTAVAIGDWDERGLDFETYLVGAVTDKIIDADRLVRNEWNNGHPNWYVYRTIYAGDRHSRRRTLDWFISYATTKAVTGAIRNPAKAEFLGMLAGWDCLCRLEQGKWLIGMADVADIGEVDPKTYRKLRNRTYLECLKSLEEYFVRLQIAVRQVWMRDRWISPETPRVRLTSGRGFEDEVGSVVGDGNYIVRKAVMSDHLR